MTPPTSEIASLNGIRALAVALVFFSHGGLALFVPGGLGVTVFFVLSGFLITTLLRREYAAHGGIQLRAFYLRRVLRLMPPLFVVVVAATLLSSLGVISGDFTLRGLFSVLFYFGNYHVIANDYHGIPEGLGVVWSLAVEEHYYLLYPPLAMILLHQARTGLSVTVLALLCLLILGWRCWLALNGASEAYLMMATDTRADSILTGCLMAFWRNPAIEAPTAIHLRRDITIAIACGLILILTLTYRNDLFRVTARYTLQSLAIAPLIVLAIIHAERAPCRWLNSKPLAYLGSISYTIYLSHQLILFFVMRHWPQLGAMATLAIAALLTLAVAETMRRWVEKPCARWRKQLHQRSHRHTTHRSSMPAAVQ